MRGKRVGIGTNGVGYNFTRDVILGSYSGTGSGPERTVEFTSPFKRQRRPHAIRPVGAKTVTATVVTTAMPGPRKVQPTEGFGWAASDGATASIIGKPITNQPTCPSTIAANILLTMRTRLAVTG